MGPAVADTEPYIVIALASNAVTLPAVMGHEIAAVLLFHAMREPPAHEAVGTQLSAPPLITTTDCGPKTLPAANVTVT